MNSNTKIRPKTHWYVEFLVNFELKIMTQTHFWDIDYIDLINIDIDKIWYSMDCDIKIIKAFEFYLKWDKLILLKTFNIIYAWHSS